MCRFTSAIGVRIIGSITLVACLVNIVIFPDSVHSLLATDEVRVTLFLKLPVDEIYQEHYDQANMNLSVLKLFCFMCVIGSCSLIWSSITCNQFLAIPWLVCIAVDVVFQALQLGHIPYTIPSKQPSTWEIVQLVTSFLTSLLVSGYVLFAAYHWMMMKSRKDKEEEGADESATPPYRRRVFDGATKSTIAFQV